ncbi:LPS-assembly protein LptD [Pseudomonadota bacterium]
MSFRRTLLASAFAAALILGGAPAYAQNNTDKAASFSADEMTHDQDLGTITARGNVEVNQAGRTLLADAISYDQTNDLIRATGHVTLHNPTGDVLFAEMMEITGDLKNGLVQDLRAVMADRSRFAAKQAQLVNDETMILDRALYTRCEPCKEDPTRQPLWQLKAVKIVHDRVNKVIEYQDAWMEFAGIPIVYTPYFSHPDPSVKRKSGFLPPRVGGSSSLGFTVRAPYFYAIDDYSDVTLTPIVTSKEYGAVAGQYRERFTRGEVKMDGSLAYDSTQNALGHIDAQARFDIDRTWRVGADLQRASTDTYMRRYNFGNQDTLTSQAFIEGFRGDNYMSAQTMAFQGLRETDNPDTTPLILPVMQYSHQGAPNKLGAYNTFDFNLAKLTRTTGTDSTRISLLPVWNLPYVAPKGDVYKLSASLGVDFFHAQDLSAPASRGGTYNGAALRVTPQVAFDWSWPMAKRGASVTEVIEPMAQIVASPYGGNSYKMANEDSQDFDFNDANLFSTNRFTGFDRVESGPRANYGLKWGVYGDNGGSTTVMVGQSYRLKADDTFQIGSGLEDNFSDYVAKVQVSPGDHLNVLYRTRLDKNSLDFRRNELAMNGNYSVFNYAADFVFFDHQQGSEYLGRKELNYSVGSKLTEFWSTNFSGVRDMSRDGGQRSMRLGFIYDDECLQFDTSLSRTFYQDREVKPTDAIMFRVVFKTLGEVTSDVTAN